MNSATDPLSDSRTIQGLALIASLLGLGLTVWGLYATPYPQVHAPWVVGVLAAALLLGITLRYGRFNILWSTAFFAIALALSAGALGPLLVVVWFCVASLLLGRWLTNRLWVRSSDTASQLLVGAGIFGTLVGLMSHFPVASAGTYGLMLALPLALGIKTLPTVEASIRSNAALQPDAERTPLSVVLDCLLGGVALLYFAFALTPEVGHDALAMHLFIPGYVQAHKQWSFDASTYVWAVMPMLGDWIFTLPYLLAGETAARLTNVGFIFLLAWLVSDLARWAGGRSTGARWAALIFLTTPLTFTEGSSLFIESIWSCMVVAGGFAVLRVCFEQEHAGQRLLLGGCLLGLALATKAVTLPLLPIFTVLLVWRYKHWLRSEQGPRQWLTGLVVFFALGGIPYATAWWLTGNPTFPFFNAIFKSPLWEPVNFEATAFGKGVPWDVLYAVTFDSGRFLEGKAGAGGFQWLLLLLPMCLVAARHVKAIALMFVGICTVFLVFHSTAYLRYVFPAYALLASAMGVGFGVTATWPRMLDRWFVALGFFTLFLGTVFLSSGAFFQSSALYSLWGPSAREKYLETRLPIRNAIPLVNALNVGKRPVAVLSQPLSAGLDADALYASWYNLGMQKPYFDARTEAALAQVLIDKNVEFLIVDKGWSAYGNLSAEQLALVPLVTDLVWEQGHVSVRKLKASYQHQTEYLRNPEFNSDADWSLPRPGMYDSATQSVQVSVDTPATQSVKVSGGRTYINTVRSRCMQEKAQGRIQVNWSDAQGKFIQTHIEVFECTPDWKEYTMQVTAPPGASQATVFATGHTQVPLSFKSVSFK